MRTIDVVEEVKRKSARAAGQDPPQGLWALSIAGLDARKLLAVLSVPPLVGAYNSLVQLVAVSNGFDPACFDPMNFTLLTIPTLSGEGIPFCLWNMTHILFFVFLAGAIPAKDEVTRHLVAFLCGIAWFTLEPVIFTAATSAENVQTAHLCPGSAYENTWRPRADDLLFNSCGQVLFEARRRSKEERA